MNTRPSSIANCGLTFVFDIRHSNWHIATKIQALRVSISIELDFRELGVTPELKLRHCWPCIRENLGTEAHGWLQ
jgi:hypothetical protein